MSEAWAAAEEDAGEQWEHWRPLVEADDLGALDWIRFLDAFFSNFYFFVYAGCLQGFALFDGFAAIGQICEVVVSLI